MFKLDNAFLEELGLGSLPPVEKNKMLAHIYETLEMRVGMKLAEQMSNEQLDEFESYINKQDEAGALKWLETNFPNYKQVVAEELEKLKAEVSQVAPQIVAQAQDNANQLSSNQPQPSSEPLTNTNSVNNVPNGTGQGSTAGQQPQQTPQQPMQNYITNNPVTTDQQSQPQPVANPQQQTYQPQQPSSEPLTNTDGVNYAPNGASQGSTIGQQPQPPQPEQSTQPQPSSEPIMNTNGANYAPNNASQQSTFGQPPLATTPPPPPPVQPWQPE
jgi:hypothetical protein